MEPNTKDAPFPLTHYPAPGLALWKDLGTIAAGVCRGLYVTSTGRPTVCIGQGIIDIYSETVLGAFPTNSGNPVRMCDNGTTLVAVDGSANGLMGPLATPTAGSMTLITDSAFYGSTDVDFIDTFLVFNQPGTKNFYTTTSNVVTPFDPTYFAAKAGWNDNLVTARCLHDNIWLLGEATTEIWYNAGAAAFPFARMPNSILQQGCTAPYSVVVTDNALYWLSQDRWGRNMLMRGEGYGAKRVSTYAMEDIWSSYSTIGDAVGMSYQIGGHESVGFWFPTANVWWAYDVSTQMWHQRMYSDPVLNTAWLPSCSGFAPSSIPSLTTTGGIVMGDRQSAKVYILQKNFYFDDATPITRRRSWSHIQADDGQRMAHTRFSASFAGAQLSNDTVQLDWSDDAGQTYGAEVPQTVNNATNGQYQWRRLGYARDRVYRLTWSGQGECALNGAYVDVMPHGT